MTADRDNPPAPGRDPDQLVAIGGGFSELVAHSVASGLEAEGIPAQVFVDPLASLQLTANPGAGATVLVRRCDLERARRFAAEMQEEARNIDWSSVEHGDSEPDPPARPVCPACGYDRTGLDDKVACPECNYRGEPRMERLGRDADSPRAGDAGPGMVSSTGYSETRGRKPSWVRRVGLVFVVAILIYAALGIGRVFLR